MAYMAMSIDELKVGLASGRPAMSGSCPEVWRSDSVVEVGPVGFGQSHELAHHPRRQPGGHVVHELDVGPWSSASAIRPRLMSRIWGSSWPMTLALKLSASGLR